MLNQPLQTQNQTLSMGPLLKVDPAHCHKALRHNAFIIDAKRIGADKFELNAQVDHQNEGFFFDHEIDHIPGMLTACILRQSVLAISHLFFEIPFSRSFIMDDIALKYSRHAPLGKPITLIASFNEMKLRGDELRGGICNAQMSSGGTVIATGSLGFRILTAELASRLARMSQG